MSVVPEKVLGGTSRSPSFLRLLWDLKSGDLYVEGSDQYADYREQLISWEEYAEQLETYGTQVALPTDGKAFVASLRDWLHARIQQTRCGFSLKSVPVL